MNLNHDQNEIQLIQIFGGYTVQNFIQTYFLILIFSYLDELKNTCDKAIDDDYDNNDDDERKSNIPEFIEVKKTF